LPLQRGKVPTRVADTKLVTLGKLGGHTDGVVLVDALLALMRIAPRRNALCGALVLLINGLETSL
jgi:hypothetical protein